MIAEQVRFLQQQAKAVLEEANLNKELHHIACNFKKVPGKIYYVYKREDSGAKYMSMISPEVNTIILISNRYNDYKIPKETTIVNELKYYSFIGVGRKLPNLRRRL